MNAWNLGGMSVSRSRALLFQQKLAHPMMILLGNSILASKDVLVSKEYSGYGGGSTLQSACHWVKSIAQMLNWLQIESHTQENAKLSLKVTGYGNGWTTYRLQWLCVLGNSHKTWKRRDTNLHSVKQWEVSKERWSKFVKFSTKLHFRKQLGGTSHNPEGQFVMFLRSGRRLFWKVPLNCWVTLFFSLPHNY